MNNSKDAVKDGADVRGNISNILQDSSFDAVLEHNVNGELQ